MRSQTERAQIRSLKARWLTQYGHRLDFVFRGGSTARDVLTRIEALDVETATAADVERAVGNRYWCAAQTCFECDRVTWDTVSLGSRYFCRWCLSAALASLVDRVAE